MILTAAVGASTILSGCTTSADIKRLDRAAEAIGRQAAGVNLPDLPNYCSDPMPTVEPKLDEPVWGTQRRWEITRDNENKRVDWCADFYGRVQKGARSGQGINDATR